MSFSTLKLSTDVSDRYYDLLTIAARVIARDGFEKASIRVIAEESNLSQAGLYHYFSSKDDLLYQIQKQTFTALRNSLAARLDPSAPALEKLRTLIRNHLEFFLARMNELCVCNFEYVRLADNYVDEIDAIRKDYFRIAHSIMREVIADNNSKLNSKRYTLYLFGSLNWIHMWFDTQRKTNIETIATEIENLTLFGIRGKKLEN